MPSIYIGSTEITSGNCINVGETEIQCVNHGEDEIWTAGCPLPALDQPLADYSISGAANEWDGECAMVSKGWIKANTGVPTFNTTTADFTRTPDLTYYFDSLPAHSTWTVGQTIHMRLTYNASVNDFRLRIRLDDKVGNQLGFDSTTWVNNPLIIDHTITATDVTNGGFRFYIYSGTPGTGTVEVSDISIYLT